MAINFWNKWGWKWTFRSL
uniref:Two-component response regulator ORR21 n=1 Tax=Rhizophora mucronata TaxID=61149 RepID=A0A2P2NU27_RHIMU